MIQDIFPSKLNIAYHPKSITENDIVFFFDGNNILCNHDSAIRFPLYREVENSDCEYVYLFAIDGIHFFLAKQEKEKEFADYTYLNINIFRTAKPKHLSFAGLTAYHLSCWYRDHQFCGKCRNPLIHDAKERALSCEKCENLIYPQIMPVIIVGIIDGEKLLMTKYAGRDYKNYALVAGFIEIGESAEEAVRREVAEEVGLKVKNIRYYQSQPWGFSGSLLLGYFADLDGTADLHIDQKELSEAAWVERSEIDVEANDFSLTNQMICEFQGGLS